MTLRSLKREATLANYTCFKLNIAVKGVVISTIVKFAMKNSLHLLQIVLFCIGIGRYEKEV